MPSAAKKSEMAKEPAGKKTNNKRRELLAEAGTATDEHKLNRLLRPFLERRLMIEEEE